MPEQTDHPCPYSRPVLDEIARMINEERDRLAVIATVDGLPPVRKLAVVDSFAGTGKRVAEHSTSSEHIWRGTELEESFIEADWVEHGNAKKLPWGSGAFNVAATSVVFPNACTDDFVSSERDTSLRHTYSHAARARVGDRSYRLHPDNAGAMPWGRGGKKRGDGSAWRSLHVAAFAEQRRAVGRGGLIIIEVSNHLVTLKRGEPQVEIDVVGWVRGEFARQGCVEEQAVPIVLRRLRHGTNREARVEHTYVIAFRAP